MDFFLDDQEDQETGEGDDTLEEQMGEQQPGSAADGRGGEDFSLLGSPIVAA